MVTRKKAPSYEPIGDTISMASAFVQATAALDVAAQFAVESKNAEVMIQVAALWIEMGTHLTGPSPEEDDEEEGEDADLESDLTPPVGFGPPTPKEIGANNGKR